MQLIIAEISFVEVGVIRLKIYVVVKVCVRAQNARYLSRLSPRWGYEAFVGWSVGSEASPTALCLTITHIFGKSVWEQFSRPDATRVFLVAFPCPKGHG